MELRTKQQILNNVKNRYVGGMPLDKVGHSVLSEIVLTAMQEFSDQTNSYLVAEIEKCKTEVDYYYGIAVNQTGPNND